MTPDEEIKWKKIKDFPNYSVSNTGLVRNDITGKLKKLQHDKSGYLVCDLYHHQKRKLYKIHRLIAEAFILNPEGKPHINHINGIRHLTKQFPLWKCRSGFRVIRQSCQKTKSCG
jgi:hypothetical protein